MLRIGGLPCSVLHCILGRSILVFGGTVAPAVWKSIRRRHFYRRTLACVLGCGVVRDLFVYSSLLIAAFGIFTIPIALGDGDC